MTTLNSFHSTNLGSIAKIQTGPFGSQLHESDYVEKGTPIITVEHLGYGRIIKNDIPFVSESDTLRLKKFLLETDDIVFSRVGSVDRSVLIRQEEDGWMFSGRCLRVRVTVKDILPAYLYYYFTQDSFRQYVRNNAVGATMPSLNSSILRRLKILYPPLPKQKQVNDILSVIDDSLANNHTRIQLLEEAARLLFREWFVYFKFPGHEKVKLVDGVPEGWEREKLNKLVSLLGGHAFKSSSYQQDGKYGIVTIKNVQQGSFVSECTDYLDDTPDAMKKHCFLSNGDILLSLTGNVGRVCLVYGENYLLNQRVAKIEPKNAIPKSFIYWMFDDSIMQKRIENLSSGAAQQNLSPVKLGEQRVILPPNQLLKSFDEIVSLINIEIIQLLVQNQKLAQARDLLLPRLMSGEIEV